MKDNHCIKLLCIICEVSEAGYYKWVNRQSIKTPKDMEDDRILEYIKNIQTKHRYRIGVDRMPAYLKRDYNVTCNHKKAYRLMKNNGLLAITKRRKKNYTSKELNPKGNKINRNFDTSCPFDKIATDMTEISKSGKKIYVSPVKDLHTHVIEALEIGYSPSLVLAINTIKHIQGSSIEYGTFFHSDQGPLYNNRQFQKILSDNNFIQSMSRKGNPIDNSPMESFFSTLKSELIYNDCINIKDDIELIQQITKYIHYYNYERIQKSLGYLTPMEFKEKELNQLTQF